MSENFGPFGNRRGSNWQGSPSAADWAGIASTTRRGFTDHTMVDNLTLIHMNGRMYDPLIARFLSPDPFVQSLVQSQSLNPYSYVWNNPLKYIDPSGFGIFSKIWKGIKGFFKSIARNLNYIAAAVLYIVGTIANAYCYGCGTAFYNVAAALIASPVRVTKGPRGFGVSYGWGFGSASGGFAGTATGPPLGTPGINPTPGIPGLMSMNGTAMQAVWAELRTMSPPNWLVDFLAGIGDVALALTTFGGDGVEYRAVTGIGSIDPNSTAYQVGYWSAVVASLGLGRVFAARGATPQALPSTAKVGLAGVTAREAAVIAEARALLSSPQLATLRAAHAAGRSATVTIGGRTIVYEPGLSASGMTLFGEGGFVIGKGAFASSGELGRTVLHELYRLSHSTSAGGVSGALAAQETAAAASFAERAAALLGL